MAQSLFSRLPSYTYPPAGTGYWSPVTSTLNWCEEDYYATVYSAEIVNSLTNLLFVYLAIRGVRNCIEHGHDTVFLVAFLAYGFTGLGSFAFHSTLRYPMQLWDELAMIYSTCLVGLTQLAGWRANRSKMNWATFSWRKSLQVRIRLAVLFMGIAVFITLYYHYLQDPTFHQNAYTVLTTVVLTRAMWMMETRLRPVIRERERKQGTSGDTTLWTMWTMVIFGLSVFLCGYGIWALDNKYCSWLRTTRRELGLPWGILLEGHGWWHLMTGYGAYFYIVWGIWLRHHLNGDQDKYRLVWPSVLTSMPDVVRVSDRLDTKKTR